MKYQYKKYQIFRKKLDVPQEVLDRVYNNELSFEEYRKYELEDKIPITCLQAKDYEIVTLFGMEKAKLLDWELIHSNDKVRDIALTLDPQEPDINNLLYRQFVDQIDPRNYSSEMKKQYPDRMLDSNFSPEFTERFYQGELTLTEIVANWSILKDKYLDKSLVSLKFDGDQMKSFMTDHSMLLELFGIDQFTSKMKEVLSTKSSREEQNQLISDFVFDYTKEHGLTKENSSLIFKYISMKEYAQRRIGEENVERLYRGLNGLPEEYLLDLPISFDQLLDSPGLNFINYYGVKNVFDFDRECGFAFTKNGGKALETFNDYLKNASRNLAPHRTFYTRNAVDDTGNQIDRPYTKEEFYEAIRRMVIYGPELANRKVDQREFTGAFRKENPNLYVEESLPTVFQTKFYSQQITSVDLKEHPEYISYLEGKSLEVCISNIPIDIHSTNGVINQHVNFVSFLNDKLDSKTTLNFLKEYSFVFGTDMGLQILAKSQIESSDSLEKMKTKIDDGIVEQLTQGQIPYSPDMPNHVKQRFPLLFLPLDTPKEIQTKFYNKSLTFEDFDKHPEWISYFNSTEIMYGFDPQFIQIKDSLNFDSFERTKETNIKKLELAKIYTKIDPSIQSTFSAVINSGISSEKIDQYVKTWTWLIDNKEKLKRDRLSVADFQNHPEFLVPDGGGLALRDFDSKWSWLTADVLEEKTADQKLQLIKLYTKLKDFQYQFSFQDDILHGRVNKKIDQYVKTWTWLIDNKEKLKRDRLSVADFQNHPEFLVPDGGGLALRAFDSKWSWLTADKIGKESNDAKLQLIKLSEFFENHYLYSDFTNDISLWVPNEKRNQYIKELTWLINNKERIDRDGFSIEDFQNHPEFLVPDCGGLALRTFDWQWFWLNTKTLNEKTTDQKLQLIELYTKIEDSQIKEVFRDDIYKGVSNEKVDQYVQAWTWLINNKERVDRAGLSITDFQNHPEFLVPDGGGLALRAFDSNWSWLTADEIGKESNDAKLQLIELYTKIEDPTAREIFVNYISYGVPNENMDQYLETMTWLINNKERIDRDELSIEDFQKHPEFLDPNRGGRALQFFSWRWRWLNADVLEGKTADQKLQLIELYMKSKRPYIKDGFVNDILYGHLNEKVDQYVEAAMWLYTNENAIFWNWVDIKDIRTHSELFLSPGGVLALQRIGDEFTWLSRDKIAEKSINQKLQLIELYTKIEDPQSKKVFRDDIYKGVSNENMDQYLETMTWLINNKERINRDGLSIEDFQKHPEFLDPNRGGLALRAFDSNWNWINKDEITKKNVDQKLQLIELYTKIEDPTAREKFVKCISYGVPNENMDQYLETMTWLINNKERINCDGLSIKDFQKHPEFLDPNRGGRALQVFDKRWAWLNHDKIMKQSNEKKLELIELYCNLNDETMKTIFVDYIIEHHKSIDDKVKTTMDRLNSLALSNSSELHRMFPQLAKHVVQAKTPIDQIEKIENVFLKNNIPTVGKVFSVFQILHPELKDFSFSDNSKVSPILKSKSDRGREVVIFSDLMKTALGSNNRSMHDYLNNIERGNQLFLGITSGTIQFDKLNKMDKEILSTFTDHLNTLYQHTKVGGKNNQKIMLTGNLASDIQQFIPLFSKDGSLDYNLPDRLISMFCHFAGFDTFQETKDYFIQSPNKADEKHRQFASQPFVLESGDFVKGINRIDYLPNILQNGSVAKEFLGSSAASDSTPLDTDLSRVITKQPTINECMNNLIANSYGPIWLVLKNDDRFVITREGAIETEKKSIDKSDLKKIEAFSTLGKDHYGIRTGFASSEIDAIITDSLDHRVGLEIAMNGFYIPVYDRMTEELVFSPKEYDDLREKMSGLSYFDTGEYHFADNLASPDVKQLVDFIPFSKADVSKKRQAIHQVVEEAIKKVGLQLNEGMDKDLSAGRVDLIDTGSTGRGTNMPGDGDFDFMLRLDNRIMTNNNNVNEIKEVLLEAFGEEHRQEVIESGDFRLKKVKIDGLEEPVDIDITFVEKMDQLEYSTDMALQDRLQTIENQDPEKYSYVVANILLAKKVLKEAGVYKNKNARENPQGGLGGVGIENWILQNGGSFEAASKEFLKCAKNKDFEKFKQNYQIWDFGENHLASKKNSYPHDNFVSKNMNEEGYEKMKKVLSKYISKKPQEPIQTSRHR